ncbi:MAG: hypothetical protein JW934_15660 [Anaerolineae bacterium]|nr:hypothetical protein [Anaerolineae bacterium]
MDKTTRIKKTKIRRPVWLKLFVLWTLGLGIIGAWRGLVLWRERNLLFELGSTLEPATLILFVALSLIAGIVLIISALGLWFKKNWARQSARIAIPAYLALVQTYTWLWARNGLMWERRWAALILAVLGIIISVGTLTCKRMRQWLALTTR